MQEQLINVVINAAFDNFICLRIEMLKTCLQLHHENNMKTLCNYVRRKCFQLPSFPFAIIYSFTLSYYYLELQLYRLQ